MGEVPWSISHAGQHLRGIGGGRCRLPEQQPWCQQEGAEASGKEAEASRRAAEAAGKAESADSPAANGSVNNFVMFPPPPTC